MHQKQTKKFPKDFFINIDPCKEINLKKSNDYDKPFNWSKKVLNGKRKGKIVLLKEK